MENSVLFSFIKKNKKTLAIYIRKYGTPSKNGEFGDPNFLDMFLIIRKKSNGRN